MPSVLITGTSKGIGFDTALAFARAGYKVHAAMRTPSQSPLSDTAAKEKLPILDLEDGRRLRPVRQRRCRRDSEISRPH